METSSDQTARPRTAQITGLPVPACRFTSQEVRGELTVVDASGTNQIPGVNLTTYGDDAMVTLTSSNTYSLSITPYTGVGTINPRWW